MPDPASTLETLAPRGVRVILEELYPDAQPIVDSPKKKVEKTKKLKKDKKSDKGKLLQTKAETQPDETQGAATDDNSLAGAVESPASRGRDPANGSDRAKKRRRRSEAATQGGEENGNESEGKKSGKRSQTEGGATEGEVFWWRAALAPLLRRNGDEPAVATSGEQEAQGDKTDSARHRRDGERWMLGGMD